MAEQIEIKQTGGVGAFFYGAIFPTIAIGLVISFGFYTGVVEWHKKQIIEGRMDARVGVNADLRDPVLLLYHGRGCIEVQRAFLDGDTLTAYLHNKCARDIKNISFSWRELSPEGTTVKSYSNYLSGNDDMTADEKREQSTTIPVDDKRVQTVVFAVHDFSDSGQ